MTDGDRDCDDEGDDGDGASGEGVLQDGFIRTVGQLDLENCGDISKFHVLMVCLNVRSPEDN